MPVNYVRGDATQPIGSENRIITHCCNDQGYWNAGFVKALSQRWPNPSAPIAAGRQVSKLSLSPSVTSTVRVDAGLCVANIIGQSGIRNRGTYPPPIRYEAIRKVSASSRTRCRPQSFHPHAAHGARTRRR